MTESKGSFSLAEARDLDARDPLRAFRSEFLFPPAPTGGDSVYLTGNSLGLQPKQARAYIEAELDDWARLGVEGHIHGRSPWLPYHENLTEPMARVVGAKPIEVVVMNTLSVNLHLMMVSFYRPTSKRYKILVEAGAFPSDQYAVASQARFHCYDPIEAIVEVRARSGEDTIRSEDILALIEKEGDSIALILIGNVNYLTGQAFDMAAITRAGHSKGCLVGFDLAHGAGNLRLRLHDDGADFAVWCGYKYLNGGPGALSGCFVHERHATSKTLPRFEGWWGQNKKTRFEMGPVFDPIPGAEGWQLSNPPIFQLAALRAALEMFDRATMDAIRTKGDLLTGVLDRVIRALPPGFCHIVTPADPRERGSQLSLRISGQPRELQRKMVEAGIICDFREPDIIRATPAPLYTRFEDVHRFVEVLKSHAGNSSRD